jgi:acyl-CoA reductase-like NAD-dependent aldehyde dehydrogenase
MATVAAQGQTCRNFINGEWSPSRSPRFVERRNPADRDEVVSVVPLSTAEEARDAVAAARAAFPAWRGTPAPARGRILSRAAQIMDRRKDELARLLTREEGKTLRDSLGEITKSIRILEFMAGEGTRLAGETLPSDFPKNFVYTLKQPLGVIGAITPWNFPVSIPVWKIAPAIVAGNTVVLKPSTYTSLTAATLLELFAQAGLPPGVVNMILGSGREAGGALVEHPDVRAVSFTGSNAVGSAIYGVAAAQQKKCQCEMGGKNPLVVLGDADLELAADAALFGAFASTGQRCTATSRVVIEEEVADRFVEMLAARTREWKVGNGLDDEVDMGPAVNEKQLEKDVHFIELGKQQARLVLGGERLGGPDYERGNFLTPAIFDHVAPDSPLAQDEIFGPVLSIVRVRDFDEALEVANSVRFGLSSALYSNDAAKIFAFIDQIETGITHINSPTVGGEAHLPFGGTKATGVGLREMGHVAVDFFTELKTVYIDYTATRRDSRAY